MLQVLPASTNQIPSIQDLAKKHHILTVPENNAGFLYTLNSTSALETVVHEGLSKVVVVNDEIAGYVLVASEASYESAYGKPLALLVEEDYKTDFKTGSAIILQAVLKKELRGKLNVADLQNKLINEIFRNGFRQIYAEGCLNPFNPRTYYVLSELCGWKRNGFWHLRLDRLTFDTDPHEVDKLGGLEKLRELHPDGMVFGLYSKSANMP